MGRDLATLVVESALFAVAGWATTGVLADLDRRSAIRLLPLAFAGPLAMLAAGYGAYRLYLELGLRPGAPAALLAIALDVVGLAAGGMLLLGARPRRRDDEGGGGSDGDLPPPPDPGGPDGWAEFERRFYEYAAAAEARTRHVLVR